MGLAFLGSPPDLLIIFVVALLIFGPKKLPEIGRQVGQAMREFRKIADEVTGAGHAVRSEVESVTRPFSTTPPPVSVAGGSSTVEHAISHAPYDQEPRDLMAPDARLIDNHSAPDAFAIAVPEHVDGAVGAVAEAPPAAVNAVAANEKGR